MSWGPRRPRDGQEPPRLKLRPLLLPSTAPGRDPDRLLPPFRHLNRRRWRGAGCPAGARRTAESALEGAGRPLEPHRSEGVGQIQPRTAPQGRQLPGLGFHGELSLGTPPSGEGLASLGPAGWRRGCGCPVRPAGDAQAPFGLRSTGGWGEGAGGGSGSMETPLGRAARGSRARLRSERSSQPVSLLLVRPRGREESDTTERLHFHFSLSCIGEGNGNLLQCSCLDNPRDGGAWWAALYGVT